MLKDLVNAVKVGNQLSDPAKWKAIIEIANKVFMGLVSLVATVRSQSPDFFISDLVLFYITIVVTVIMVVANMYFNRATTRKDVSAALDKGE
jgi:hypothetical protein